MKKIVLSIIFMFVSISGIFANNINIVDSIKYNINFNTEQLARTLQMTDEQKDRFDYLNEYCKVIYLDRTQGKKMIDMYVYNFKLVYGPLIEIGVNPWL